MANRNLLTSMTTNIEYAIYFLKTAMKKKEMNLMDICIPCDSFTSKICQRIYPKSCEKYS